MHNTLVFSQDMMNEVCIRYLKGSLFEGDANGLLLQINVFRNGVAESLSGVIVAEITRSDGALVVQNGEIAGEENNCVNVTIPTSALMPGQINIIIKNISENIKTTIIAFSGIVVNVNGTSFIDPGSVIPSLSDFTALVTRAEAAAATVRNLSFSTVNLIGDDYLCAVRKW